MGKVSPLTNELNRMLSRIGRILSSIVLAVALLGAGGCGTVLDALRDLGGPGDAPVESGMAATYFGEPKVRPGVVLAISVTATGQPGHDSKQYPVDAEGYITMDLIGRIKVDALTLVAVQEKIATAYKKYYLEPNVNAVFVYQAGQSMVSPWGTVTVLGEVHRPGPVDVPQTMDLTVLRALQLAGGCTSIADKHRIRVTRCDKDGRQTRNTIDIIKMGEDGRRDMDMVLKAGDVVWVPMSWY